VAEGVVVDKTDTAGRLGVQARTPCAGRQTHRTVAQWMSGEPATTVIDADDDGVQR
jgi:hypothetical protein